MSENAIMAKSAGKIEIRADDDWVKRVDAEAARLQLKRSAYIRMVVTEAMDRAEAKRRADRMSEKPEEN